MPNVIGKAEMLVLVFTSKQFMDLDEASKLCSFFIFIF